MCWRHVSCFHATDYYNRVNYLIFSVPKNKLLKKPKEKSGACEVQIQSEECLKIVSANTWACQHSFCWPAPDSSPPGRVGSAPVQSQFTAALSDPHGSHCRSLARVHMLESKVLRHLISFGSTSRQTKSNGPFRTSKSGVSSLEGGWERN